MGQPQRVSSLDGAVVGDVDWLDDEDSGPWCVDDGVSIHVMKSRDIYDAVERGDLTPETKVWRDGRACWLAIAECHELTVEPSGIRRIERPQQPTEPPPDEDGPRSRLVRR